LARAPHQAEQLAVADASWLLVGRARHQHRQRVRSGRRAAVPSNTSSTLRSGRRCASGISASKRAMSVAVANAVLRNGPP
jgi:hypothetical protein